MEDSPHNGRVGIRGVEVEGEVGLVGWGRGVGVGGVGVGGLGSGGWGRGRSPNQPPPRPQGLPLPKGYLEGYLTFAQGLPGAKTIY